MIRTQSYIHGTHESTHVGTGTKLEVGSCRLSRHGTAPRACRRSLWCGRWRPERTWRDLQRCAVVPVGVDPAHAPVQSFIEVSENVKEDTVETEDIFRV